MSLFKRRKMRISEDNYTYILFWNMIRLCGLGIILPLLFGEPVFVGGVWFWLPELIMLFVWVVLVVFTTRKLGKIILLNFKK